MHLTIVRVFICCVRAYVVALHNTLLTPKLHEMQNTANSQMHIITTATIFSKLQNIS